MPRKSMVVQQKEALPVQLLDIDGVATLLCIGRTKVFELIKHNNLPCLRWGARCTRFDPRDIATWLEKQKESA